MALSGPRSHLLGTGYRMAGWIMRNTAELSAHWSLDRLTIYKPVVTLDGKAITYSLPEELPGLIEQARKLRQ
jgi:hypothetical protein